MTQPSIICSTSSLQANEPLPGTAPRADIWMLLEYDGVWGEKALEESQLPETVKAHLVDLRKLLPNSKLLLIRQHLAHSIKRRESRLAIKPSKHSIRFYIALASKNEPLLYDFKMERYEDLLELDIPGVVARKGMYNANLSNQSLVIVCTNGKRDWCCARFGADIYHEMFQAATPGLSIWQSTHVGGHRFAPNIACFPHGLFYGRVNKDDIRSLLDSCTRGQIYPGRARGRSCYPAHIQAAEIYLQMETSSSERAEYELTSVVERQPDEWVVSFQFAHSGSTSSLVVRKEESREQVYKSCKDTEPVLVRFYKVVDFKILEE